MRQLKDIRIHSLKEIPRLPVEHIMLPGEIPMHIARGGAEPVIQLEFIFSAGRAHSAIPPVANATAGLLSEGTSRFTSAEISEQMEYLGTTLKCQAGMDALSINLYCLSRHFEESVRMVTHLLTDANFPQHEFDSYFKRRLQKLRISMQRNEYLANMHLAQRLYGEHPYGKVTTEDSLRQIERSHLVAHAEYLGAGNLMLFASGQLSDEQIRFLGEELSSLKEGRRPASYGSPLVTEATTLYHEGPQKYQCAVRIGALAPDKDHDDFSGLYALNMLLGGYFGSRLMRNIREEKGMTYHIFSSLDSLARASNLVIGTEAATDNLDNVLVEIEREMDRLKHDPVPEKEIEMVRNYLMGSLMMQLDGPFRTIDVLKGLILEGQSMDFLETLTAKIQSITSQELQDLAVTYLTFDNMHKSIVR